MAGCRAFSLPAACRSPDNASLHPRPLVKRLPVLFAACLALAGCDGVLERSTRNEIHQLAYRSSQMHAALEACNADEALLGEHGKAWNDALGAADGWIGLSAASIAGRQAAGREAFDGLPESACALAQERARASIGEARRWGERIAARRLCSPMGCEN